ncbi:APC family permease [Azotosporobacter soli]|uniref:APC family permease n=1 Tax=Azotosporobacter soli TaxID=3055040 RepID=UPI0031FE97B2
MEKESQADKLLKRELGLIPAMALVVGMVIGSGIFMKPGKVLLAAGDSTLGLAAWVIGGIITVTAGLTIAELGAQIPRTGGMYAYLDEVYGKFWAYLFGWVQTLIYGPATIGALGLYFSALLIPFLNIPTSYKMPLAILAVAFISGINCLGARCGGMIQSVATIAKLIPIACIAVFGLWQGNGQILNMSSGVSESAGMGAAILATLWAYDGWIAAGFVAGEMKNPAKLLPRAIILGLGIVIVAYLSVNVAVLHVLPAAEIAALGPLASGAAAGILFGDIGGKLISIGILVSIFGALNGYIMTNARVPYAMAVAGQLPGSRFLAKVHKEYGTPVGATLFQVCMAVLLMTLGDPDRLTDIAMFMIQIFYLLAFVAVFLLRKRQPAAERPYKVPLYPVVPAVAILGGLYIIGSTLLNNPQDTLYALSLTLLGVPVYWLMLRQKKGACGAKKSA